VLCRRIQSLLTAVERLLSVTAAADQTDDLADDPSGHAEVSE
jgi:hypothetical protein